MQTAVASSIASEKPFRNTAASSASRTNATRRFASPSRGCKYGFCVACLAASEADNVMVITKSVVANPSSTKTMNLPHHPGSRFSSIAMEPNPA